MVKSTLHWNLVVQHKDVANGLVVWWLGSHQVV